MVRDNNVVLNDEELEALKDVRQTMYGTDEIPYGAVIKKLIEHYQDNGGDIANV